MLWNLMVAWFVASYVAIGYFIYKLEAKYHCGRWRCCWKNHVFNLTLWWVTFIVRIAQIVWYLPNSLREYMRMRRSEREGTQSATS